MKLCINGDSFCQHLENSYLQVLRDRLNLEVIQHKSWPGGCEFYSHNTFKELICYQKPDIALFLHTEPSRLPCEGNYPINYLSSMMERGSIEDHKIIPEQVLQAARSYYENICHFRFHQTIHHLMLAESARICHRAGIKSVHIHCFNDNFYGEHGLWIMNGLHFFAERHSGVDYYKAGRLRNHMDDELNNKLGIWLADRIGYYLDNNLDHQVVFLDHHELG